MIYIIIYYYFGLVMERSKWLVAEKRKRAWEALHLTNGTNKIWGLDHIIPSLFPPTPPLLFYSNAKTYPVLHTCTFEHIPMVMKNL
jgi:hypothetical protein